MNDNATYRTDLKPGTWITVPLEDGRMLTGKFSGIYENARYGTMFRLSFARYHDAPDVRDTCFFFLPKAARAFNDAFEVSGPLRPGKPAPKPVGVVH